VERGDGVAGQLNFAGTEFALLLHARRFRIIAQERKNEKKKKKKKKKPRIWDGGT